MAGAGLRVFPGWFQRTLVPYALGTVESPARSPRSETDFTLRGTPPRGADAGVLGGTEILVKTRAPSRACVKDAGPLRAESQGPPEGETLSCDRIRGSPRSALAFHRGQVRPEAIPRFLQAITLRPSNGRWPALVAPTPPCARDESDTGL